MRKILVPLSLLSLSLWGLRTAPAVAPLDQDPPGEEEVQDPGQEGNYTRDIFGRLRKAKSNPFKGAWELLDMDLDGYPPEGLSGAGALLIGDQFMAFEVQASWDPFVVGVILDDGYQSFIAEYMLEGGNLLLCRTLVGSYLDEETGSLAFEPHGIEREFEVRLENGFLQLRWGESDLLTFGRRLPGRWVQTDIFGNESARTVPEDIFGRRRTDVGGQEGDEEGSDG